MRTLTLVAIVEGGSEGLNEVIAINCGYTGNQRHVEKVLGTRIGQTMGRATCLDANSTHSDVAKCSDPRCFFGSGRIHGTDDDRPTFSITPIHGVLMATHSRLSRLLTAFTALALSTGLAMGAEPGAKPAATPYPLDHCIVSGDKFGGDMGEPIVKVYDGREIKLCCKECVPKYEKDPAKYNAKIDAEDKQAKPAPAAGKTP